MRRSLTILLCLFAAVLIGGSAAANAAAAPPAAEQSVTTAGDWHAAAKVLADGLDLHAAVPNLDQRKADVQSTALLAEIGPYADWRWQSGAGAPLVCVDNQSSKPFQQAAGQWNTNPDFTVLYENGNDCAGYSDAYRIDIMNGYADNGQCFYTYILTAGGVVSRAILYANTTTPNCWDSTIRTNHFTSKGLGVMLGVEAFATGDADAPSYVSVMRVGSHDSVSWPQAGDHNTLAYYNGVGALGAAALPIALWLHRRRNRRPQIAA